MSRIFQSAHDQLVREVADRYIREGYRVKIEPSDADLPAFLKGYHPDLIVTTSEGQVVIEVKTTGKVRRLDYWEGLKKAIEAHPGWRFRLVLDNRREEELSRAERPILSDEEIEERLLASRELAGKGLLDSALVVAWSALEATLRKASRAQGLNLPDQGPGLLITSLYTEADLERKDYHTLMHILSERNLAAHGIRVENLDRSDIDQVNNIAHHLLKQYRQAA